jgi:hypothetical protein
MQLAGKHPFLTSSNTQTEQVVAMFSELWPSAMKETAPNKSK